MMRREIALFFLALACFTGCGPTLAERQQGERDLQRLKAENEKRQHDMPIYETYRKQGTVEGFQEFLERYPDNVFAHEAQTALDTIVFKRYSERGMAKDYEEFLARYPKSIWGPEAEKRLTQLRANPELQALPSTQSKDIPLGARREMDLIVTAGSISQTYEVLGEVHVNTRGMINFGSMLNDALFRSRLSVAAGGRTPTAHTEQMNKFLKEKAREQYGYKVDAIINTTYNTDHDGDVFASGLAVHFVDQRTQEPQQPPTPSERHLEDRLKELKNLREKGLISSEEYYQKRQELLEGL